MTTPRGYGTDEVDFSVLWDAVQYDLPMLIPGLEEILAGLPGEAEPP